MPAQSNMIDLHTPDSTKNPELKPTELESSLIRKNLIFKQIFTKNRSGMSALRKREDADGLKLGDGLKEWQKI